jgi:predicted O-methyltransferase YrrM
VIIGKAIQVIPGLTGCFDFVFIGAEKSEYLDYLWLGTNCARAL